jgi:hypothetical protein
MILGQTASMQGEERTFEEAFGVIRRASSVASFRTRSLLSRVDEEGCMPISSVCFLFVLQVKGKMQSVPCSTLLLPTLLPLASLALLLLLGLFRPSFHHPCLLGHHLRLLFPFRSLLLSRSPPAAESLLLPRLLDCRSLRRLASAAVAGVVSVADAEQVWVWGRSRRRRANPLLRGPLLT